MGVFSARVSSVDDTGKEVVAVPEWDGLRIEVRSISLAQRNSIAASTRDKKGETVVNKFYAALIIASCFVPEGEEGAGEKAFDLGDMGMLQQKNAGATDRLAKVAMRLSGFTESSADDDDDDDEPDEDSLEAAVEGAGKASSSTATSD